MRQCLALISAFAAVCVRTEGGEKLTQWVLFLGGGLHRGVGVLECECMHVNTCVCVWGIWCHANRDWWEEVNKQGQEPFRKCVELEMDTDNHSIRVLILLFEALLLFSSVSQSVSQMNDGCMLDKHQVQRPNIVPKTWFLSHLSSYKWTLYP